ncbi:MAG: hypothetical protein JWO24_216 [Rhodospirillales bacterium]|nr:hypothetical protein [Rhodospirillales bacterium]
MTQGSPVERPKSPLTRRLLVMRATTLGALSLALGGCILRDGVAGGMFPVGA